MSRLQPAVSLPGAPEDLGACAVPALRLGSAMTDVTPHTELQSLLRQHLADQEALRLAAEMIAARDRELQALRARKAA
jgi:hypothetical protein